MWPFDDEEEEQNLAIDQAGTPETQPMNPQVKDYIAQKYNLAQYSPDARKKIEDENNADRSGPNWAAALGALGAGIAGRDAGAAGQSILNSQEAGRKGKLESFDKNRGLAVQDMEIAEKGEKNAMAKKKFASESDPNSPESKMAQELAVSMGMKPELVSGLTATKFKEISPALKTKYEITEEGKRTKILADSKKEERTDRAQTRKDEIAAKAAQVGTPGQKALDTSFAREYNDWTSGGEASVDKNLTRLKDAKAKLEGVKNDLIQSASGAVTGRLPNILRTEESKTLEQDVRAAAQGALRATLGSQFTEKEGERIMSAAYDPTLSPEANIKKIDAAIAELESGKLAKNAKAQHFDEHGTLKGLANSAIPRPPADLVKVQAPDGKIKLVPKDQVTAALKGGGKLVDSVAGGP